MKQSLRIQRIGVDNLKAINTRDAELRAQEMYRARLHGYVELLVGPQSVAAALQKIAERRFVGPPYARRIY